MPRRAVPVDPSIGSRVRERRQRRGWSQRYAADRAGISHTSWRRIENGAQRADRYMVADLATALECSTTDLTGQPSIPADRQLEIAHARVPRLWQALVHIAPGQPADRPAMPLAELRRRMETLDQPRDRADYTATGQLLPDLLVDLHAATAGPDGKPTMRMLIEAIHTARGTLRGLGYRAEYTFAAERVRQWAERLDEPTALALAAWCQANSAMGGGAYHRSAALVDRAISDLDHHLAEPAALELLGMLHLAAGASVLAERRTEDALAHIGEAERIAARTGESSPWWLTFGPTNVGIWRMGVEVDSGQPGRALETAKGLQPAAVASLDRRAAYYVETARALTDLGGRRDDDAKRMLLTAERIAPQRVRSWTPPAETARFLLHRARARDAALVGLCERLGVAAG
jgi:transcriptional regulator with XRE-family HTH domain